MKEPADGEMLCGSVCGVRTELGPEAFESDVQVGRLARTMV